MKNGVKEMGKHIKKLKSKKQITQLFKDLQKDIEKHPIKHWFSRKWFQLKNFPSDIRLKMITFIQRGKKGWSYPDTWSFDCYLTDIIIGGLKHLRKYAHGYPVMKNINSNRQWKGILQKIINGFEAYKKISNWSIYYKKSTYKKLNKKFKEGMKLFVKYYGALWD